MAVNVYGISHVQYFSDGRKEVYYLRFDIELWCRENIGPKHFININEMVFDCDEDAVAFKLRWL